MLIIIALAIMSWIALGRIEANTRKDITKELVTVLNETRGSLRAWIHNQKNNAEDWTTFDDIHEVVRELLALPRNRETLLASSALKKARELVKHEVEESETLGFFIIAPDYVSLASMRDSNVGTTNLLAGRKDYLARVFKGQLVLTMPIKSDVPLPRADGSMEADAPTMFVMAPVFDTQGAVMAALAFRVDPRNDFSELVRLGRIGATGETYAFNRSGEIVSPVKFLNVELRDPGMGINRADKPFMQKKSWPLTRMAGDATAGGNGVDLDGYRDCHGVKVVGAWVWDDDMGLGLATEIDFDTAFETFKKTRTLILAKITITSLLFFAFTIALYISRKNESITSLESRELARFYTENPNPVIRISGDGKVLVANTASKPILESWNAREGEMIPGDLLNRIKGKIESGNSGELEIKTGANVCLISLALVDERGYINMYGIDITDRKQYLEQIKLAASIFENTVEGVITTAPDGAIQAVNKAFTQITGYSRKEALGANPRILRSDKHSKEFYRDMWDAIIKNGFWRGEIWNRRKNGEVYPEWMTITSVKDNEGEVIRYVSVFHDMTQLKASEEEVRRLAYHDPLTGLPNRLLFRDRLAQAIAHAHRSGLKLAVILIDLDNFKYINDTMGHLAGDELLQETGRRLLKCVRESDTVSRLGGDEFMIILNDVDREGYVGAKAIAMIEELALPFDLKSQERFITASVGIALYPSDGKDVDTLIKHSDIAMYRAKEAGKNNYQLYKPEMNEKILKRFQLETDLRRAMERDEFIIHYQPKVDIATGSIAGAEALVRWRKTDGTIVSPADFIPVTEETGLIIPLGEWLMCMVAGQLTEWIEAGYKDISIAINLSVRQFEQDKLVNIIKSILSGCDFPPTSLEFEITESHLVSNVEKAKDVIGRIKQTGVSLALDDFGTGYSSLSYLLMFPFDTIKIDKSFVDKVPNDERGEYLLASIIAMAKNIGLKVVAEGVETKEQVDFLIDNNCDMIQGYYFSRPVPPDQFTKLLETGKLKNILQP